MFGHNMLMSAAPPGPPEPTAEWRADELATLGDTTGGTGGITGAGQTVNFMAAITGDSSYDVFAPSYATAGPTLQKDASNRWYLDFSNGDNVLATDTASLVDIGTAIVAVDIRQYSQYGGVYSAKDYGADIGPFILGNADNGEFHSSGLVGEERYKDGVPGNAWDASTLRVYTVVGTGQTAGLQFGQDRTLNGRRADMRLYGATLFAEPLTDSERQAVEQVWYTRLGL